MVDNYIGLLEDIDSITAKEQVDMKELEIPVHAAYSGTKGLVIDKSELKNIFELLGFNSLWFSTEMHIYAWHKEYKLFNKTEKVENHYILIYHNAFIYLRTQHTNKTKVVIDLFGGKTVNSKSELTAVIKSQFLEEKWCDSGSEKEKLLWISLINSARLCQMED